MMNAYIDFHCHILPGMDFDGTDDIEETVAMCSTLKSQGVATVCATPHFYPWNDNIDEFLARRERTLSVLTSRKADIEIIPGAEVQIFKSLAEYRIDRLCFGNSNVIMLEMPYAPFENWMITAIENAVLKYQLIPIIAHVERYRYPRETLEKLSRIHNVIFQISVSELSYKASVKDMDKLSSLGVPVIFGSDAHNTSDRAPKFDLLGELLEKEAGIFNKSLKTAKAIIENCLYSQDFVEEKIRAERSAGLERIL